MIDTFPYSYAVKVASVLSVDVQVWLEQHCPYDYIVEKTWWDNKDGKTKHMGNLVFARSADALAFRLTFPTE